MASRINGELQGFFAAKSARKMQKLKEKLGLAHKLLDNNYESLQRTLKTTSELAKKPIRKLRRYVDAVRGMAFAYSSLCRALRSLLALGRINGEEERVSRLLEIQNDIQARTVKFVNTLEELGTWIRCKQMRISEKELVKVKNAVELCEERRLDSVVVNKLASRGHSINTTGNSSVYSNNGHMDNAIGNKTFPGGNTSERVNSVQHQATDLYDDAKSRAIDALNDALESNVESMLEILTVLQPLEAGCETKIARSKAHMISLFYDMVRDSPMFAVDQELDFKELRTSWTKLAKSLHRYSDSVSEVSKAKLEFQQAIVLVVEGNAATGTLRKLTDATRTTSALPVYQFRDVCDTLQKSRGKLERAEVIQDLSRSYVVEETRGTQDLRLELVLTLRSCLKHMKKAEEEIKSQAKDNGKRWKAELKEYNAAVFRRPTNAIPQSFLL